MVAIVLTSLPVSQAQTLRTFNPGEDRRAALQTQISSYEDDPFVRASDVRRMNSSRFGLDEDGRPVLWSNRVTILEEDFIYRKDAQTLEFSPFAWNPWPLRKASNPQGDFRFQDEARFPLFKVERGPDGKPIVKDGLQVWTPNNLHLGDTTAFEAANAVKDAADAWAGRDVAWGVDGRLDIEPHVFVDFNAFYSPSARQMFFGVVPYRLKGETDVKMFETASSWDMVAHESGHALHNALKPNIDNTDQGFNVWGESFGDQTAMWASLRNPQRIQRLLAETHGNLNQSNSLTRIGEAFAALVGTGTGIRDAFNDNKISDTSDEIHDRSAVLSGAAYKIFLKVYDDLKGESEPEEALRRAGEVMGIFLTRSTDYTPENQMTLEDVAKAYLKVDKEIFGGRYHNVLVDEFTQREIFDANSEHEWLAREDSLPYLYLSNRPTDQEVEEILRANVDRFGLGQDFGLTLQSVTHDERFGQTIVRAQLTLGRGVGAPLLNNHGVLIFRADGLLADYHMPLQQSVFPQEQAQVLAQARQTIQLRGLLSQARRLRLDQHGALLSIVRKADGQLSVEARVLRGDGLNAHMEVFTPDNPRGERREILIQPVPPDKRIPIPDDILN
jgi:hypothetical protein